MAASSESKPGPKTRQLSRRRLWAFRCIAVSFSVLLLVVLEGLLRLFGFGVPTNFALKDKVAGQEMRVSNPRFAWQFFGQDLAREALPFALTPEKDGETCRIFVLGGSAAMGIPEPTFGMAHALEVMLRHRHPGVDFEVTNVAITATNSHVVLPVAKECSGMDADLLVVYLGNNEVVGPYGAGTVFEPLAGNRGVIRAAMAARSLRIAQLIQSTVTRRPDWQEWKGMEMFLEGQVRLGDEALAKTQAHFEANLRDICQAGHRKGAGVVLSTVGVNLRNCAPFASLHAEDLGEAELGHWNEAFERGVAHAVEERWEEAITAFEAAAAIDEEHAELHYRLGRCREALGRHVVALESYSRARDLDTLRFRADTGINAIIRRVAADEGADGVVLADAEARLAEAAPHGIPGAESFFEHVHLRFEGNVVVARALADAAEQALPEWVKKRRASVPPLSAGQCAERMAYTPLARHEDLGSILEMMGKPPFINQLEHEDELSALEEKRSSLDVWTTGGKAKEALAAMTRVTDAEGAGPRLRAHVASLLLKYGGDPGEAERIVSDLADELPATDEIIATTHVKALLAQERVEEAEARFQAAVEARPWDENLLGEMGQAFLGSGEQTTAHDIFAELVDRRPDNPKANNNLGTALSRLGRLDEAVDRFQEALRIHPDFAEVHHNLGIALQALARPEEAVTHYEKALEIKPDFADAHYDLGIALQAVGRNEEAVDHYRKALATRSDFAEAWLNLGNALQGLERYREAAESYEKGIQVRPDFAELHNNLGIAVQSLGRPDEAIIHFRETLRLESDHVRAHYNLGNALLKQGSFAEAATHLEFAAKSNPGSITVLTKLAVALAQAGRFQEAVPLFGSLLQANPGHAGFHDQLGLCLLHLGRLDEATAHLNEAIRLAPGFLDPRVHMGQLLVRQGNFNEALQQYEDVLKSKPDHLPALKDLAWILATSTEAKLRDGQRAGALAKEAARLTAHENPLILDVLSAAHAEVGNFEEAVRWQKKAVELAPEAMRKELRQRLELYIAGKPFREAPARAGSPR